MARKYTLFIDESGEAGVANVRTSSASGASPFMTLGGVIIANESMPMIEASLETVKAEFGKKDLHCSQLKHDQIVYFARMISQINLRLFGLISRKETLGSYKADISDSSAKYYNKCVQYLLERVGWFMKDRQINPGDLEIIFEKANFDYDQMKNFLFMCQRNPQRKNTRYLQNLDINLLRAQAKNEQPALKIADLVAHSLYKCVEGRYGIAEPRYISELSKRFFGDPKTGEVLNAGVYCVHSVEDLSLQDEVKDVLKSLTTKLPSVSASPDTGQS